MKSSTSLAVAFLVATTNHLVPAAATISLGHDTLNNYAWLTGSQPCNPVLISPYGSSECGVEFDIAEDDSDDDVAPYRLQHCGETTEFQLQEHAGGDGWALYAYCEPAPLGGDGRMDCSSSVLEEWRCG